MVVQCNTKNFLNVCHHVDFNLSASWSFLPPTMAKVLAKELVAQLNANLPTPA